MPPTPRLLNRTNGPNRSGNSSLTGTQPPDDRTLDGFDLSPVLFDGGSSPRDSMFYYHGTEVFAVRSGLWKAHFRTKTSYTGQKEALIHDPPLLYHLDHDPSEKYDMAETHPEIVERLTELKKQHEASVVPVENQLEL